jgi:uncharacterized membrane protein
MQALFDYNDTTITDIKKNNYKRIAELTINVSNRTTRRQKKRDLKKAARQRAALKRNNFQ